MRDTYIVMYIISIFLLQKNTSAGQTTEQETSPCAEPITLPAVPAPALEAMPDDIQTCDNTQVAIK